MSMQINTNSLDLAGGSRVEGSQPDFVADGNSRVESQHLALGAAQTARSLGDPGGKGGPLALNSPLGTWEGELI